MDLSASGMWHSMGLMARLIVIALFVISTAVGLAAILTGNGRRWAIFAVTVSLLANPLVLVWLFSLLRRLS